MSYVGCRLPSLCAIYSELLHGCGLLSLSLCAILSSVSCGLPSLCATVSCWLLTALTMHYGEYIMLVADCRHCALQWVVANWLWTALTMCYSELCWLQTAFTVCYSELLVVDCSHYALW